MDTDNSSLKGSLKYAQAADKDLPVRLQARSRTSESLNKTMRTKDQALLEEAYKKVQKPSKAEWLLVPENSGAAKTIMQNWKGAPFDELAKEFPDLVVENPSHVVPDGYALFFKGKDGECSTLTNNWAEWT